MARMKERNGSVAREKDCAACGGYDILPTTRRQQKVIGYMKKMTATIGLAAAIMPPAAPAAGPATNSFVVVEAEGVRAAGDGSFHFAGATSSVPVRVVARDGWRVEGSKSVSFVRTAGQSGSFRVRSVLGEDEAEIPHHDCDFTFSATTNHVPAPAVSAIPAMERIVSLYALPQTGAWVSASASLEVVSNGVHKIVRTWLPCAGCDAVHDPPVETWTETVYPDPVSWTSTACGVSTNSNVWTGFMRKGNARRISFEVAYSNSCPKCSCSASASTLVDVHELSASCGPYVGLDRTDAGRSNVVARTASASISPAPLFPASYSWTECGICSFTGRTDLSSAAYFAPDPDVASASYLAERLTVAATVTNECGSTASAACTTNFTVVKVDVAIGGVGEDKEETEGAFVQFVPDSDGAITEEGTNKMVAVTFSCLPALPAGEMVTVTHSGEGELYEELANGELVEVTTADYPACEIGSRVFKLHGHDISWEMCDGEIRITHNLSGASDVARYTDFSISLVTPNGDPVANPVDSGDGQNEFTYSSANPGVLTMNLKASASPAGFAARIKDDCRFAVGSIGNSTMAWAAANPGGAPTVDGGYLCATATFTGLPANNSYFGKKEASISYGGEVFDRNDYEVFFLKFGKNHPECSSCPECSNWFYYWREGDVCSIPKDALWSAAEGDHENNRGWHSNGTIYLTDLAAMENDDQEGLAACFSNPTCEFRIEMEQGVFGIDVTDKSQGEEGIAYSVKVVRTTPDPDEHTIKGIGGDGKGIGCAAQVAVHELGHETYWYAGNETGSQSDSYLASMDSACDEFGGDSIEYAYAKLVFLTWKWLCGDGDRDGVTDSEERDGGSAGIVSDMDNRDTYNFASATGNSCYSEYGDEEIRMRALETNAVYNVGMDWSNPGCQYSRNPYGPKK